MGILLVLPSTSNTIGSFALFDIGVVNLIMSNFKNIINSQNLLKINDIKGTNILYN